ncbi:sulfatase family protein [Rubinisphaera margarita]|uniref:sulfatase family protein n=1 Tax=Rubinisphaera margarita TaxID=2909586 RepID=UPI001EE7CB80|nr:sulfatase [Rubinisphaera margarita]MCG6158008.1 sulfatase [Rubinisphaera margarita]
MRRAFRRTGLIGPATQKLPLLIVAATWFHLAGGSSSTWAESPKDAPNFVLIYTDDQGYQDVGCFGSPDIRTPRLDAMAEAGMKFTSFYAQPVCGPSRASLMTGCYPMRVAERGNTKQVHPILHENEITIAEILKTRGYATACFGKWDLAKHAQEGFFLDLFPTRQGFDEFYGTPTSNDRVVNLYRNEQLIEKSSNMATLTRRYTDEAIEFIRKSQNEPFFVYMPHTMPHTRLAASAEFKGKSKRGLYGDVIEEIDFNVGRILDVLDELGLTDNTYVFYTSDNGPWLIKNRNHADGHLPGDHGGSAGPLRSGKTSTFEGGVRVPAILWGPGRVPAGTTCESIATTMDILPTLAALAGADVPADRVIDGEDITHLFQGRFEEADPDKTYFYYLHVHLQAVRQGRWKLHLPRKPEASETSQFHHNPHIAPADKAGFDSPFLVDLHEDLSETENVAAEHPQVVEHLLELAESMRADLGDYDRVGENMRFFDLADVRPAKPPVPPPRHLRRQKAPRAEK